MKKAIILLWMAIVAIHVVVSEGKGGGSSVTREELNEREARMQEQMQALAQVQAQLEAQVKAQVQAQVEAQVQAQLEAQVKAQVQAQVQEQMQAQMQAQVQVQAQITEMANDMDKMNTNWKNDMDKMNANWKNDMDKMNTNWKNEVNSMKEEISAISKTLVGLTRLIQKKAKPVVENGAEVDTTRTQEVGIETRQAQDESDVWTCHDWLLLGDIASEKKSFEDCKKWCLLKPECVVFATKNDTNDCSLYTAQYTQSTNEEKEWTACVHKERFMFALKARIDDANDDLQVTNDDLTSTIANMDAMRADVSVINAKVDTLNETVKAALASEFMCVKGYRLWSEIASLPVSLDVCKTKCLEMDNCVAVLEYHNESCYIYDVNYIQTLQSGFTVCMSFFRVTYALKQKIDSVNAEVKTTTANLTTTIANMDEMKVTLENEIVNATTIVTDKLTTRINAVQDNISSTDGLVESMQSNVRNISLNLDRVIGLSIIDGLWINCPSLLNQYRDVDRQACFTDCQQNIMCGAAQYRKSDRYCWICKKDVFYYTQDTNFVSFVKSSVLSMALKQRIEDVFVALKKRIEDEVEMLKDDIVRTAFTFKANTFCWISGRGWINTYGGVTSARVCASICLIYPDLTVVTYEKAVNECRCWYGRDVTKACNPSDRFDSFELPYRP